MRYLLYLWSHLHFCRQYGCAYVRTPTTRVNLFAHQRVCGRRHRCIIDLQENCLRIGTTGHSTRFLRESEIPASETLGGDKEGGGAAAEGGGAPAFPEELVQRLIKLAGSVGLGGDFSREQVLEALTVSDGDPDRAASYLLEQAAGMT